MKDAPEDLKTERLRRGWTLQDACNRTRINLTVLKALESGKTAQTGASASVEALIAKYRAALRMEESRCEERPPETEKPAGRNRKFLHVLFGVCIGALLVAVCLVAFSRKSIYSAKSSGVTTAASSAKKSAPPASAVAETKAPEAKKKAAAVSALPAASGKPSESASKGGAPASAPHEASPAPADAKEKTSSTEGLKAKPPTAKKTAPASAGAATGLAAPVGAPVSAGNEKHGPVAATMSAPAPENLSSATGSKVTPRVAASPHSIQVSAEKKTWVQVTLDGRKTESVLLQPGQSRAWNAAKKVYLIVGNAGGVNVLWDGKPVAMSNAPGRVIRMSLPEN
ncbi:MAG: RodZ domain-containing protein [Syntrophobacteraceae bacterium]